MWFKIQIYNRPQIFVYKITTARQQIGLLRSNLKRIKQRLDHAEHGGALLLGVNGVAVISHGSSNAPSIFNAIRLSKEAVDNGVIGHLQGQYQKVAASVTNGE